MYNNVNFSCSIFTPIMYITYMIDYKKDISKQEISAPSRFWIVLGFVIEPGLPDFSWYKTPKQGKIYQTTMNYTKCQ
jgi:hypothetical protein